VVTYVTLCGKPPFYGSPMTQLKNMKAEVFPFTKGVWVTASDEMKDFIRSLLKADPKERLKLDELSSHPWLASPESKADITEAILTKSLEFTRVLSNLEQFSHAPNFFSICCASVARQLDYRSLKHIHEFFCRIDKNGDGFITPTEFKDAFREVFGEDSLEYQDSGETFHRLDLDASGVITYTEFCAGGLGENMFSQEHVLWAAFKTFDLTDDGQVSKTELQQVLSRADVHQVWTPAVCEAVAKDVFEDISPKGTIDHITFNDWLKIMREYALAVNSQSPRRISKSENLLQMELGNFRRNSKDSKDRDSERQDRDSESDETTHTDSRRPTSSFGLSDYALGVIQDNSRSSTHSRSHSSEKGKRSKQSSSESRVSAPASSEAPAAPAAAPAPAPAATGPPPPRRTLLQRLACCSSP
jgi:Ca2+-binding EF-hand superfamily protein